MKLYLKQRIFSLGDKYDIYDENENVVFDVSSELFTIGAKLHLCNTNGQELYYIKRRFTLFLAQYEVYQNNTICATINQELSFLSAKLNVDSCYGNLEINGEFLSMNYDISKDGQYYASIHKKWLSWGDSYEIDIPESENAGFICALVIAIDNCLHNESNSGS